MIILIIVIVILFSSTCILAYKIIHGNHILWDTELEAKQYREKCGDLEISYKIIEEKYNNILVTNKGIDTELSIKNDLLNKLQLEREKFNQNYEDLRNSYDKLNTQYQLSMQEINNIAEEKKAWSLEKEVFLNQMAKILKEETRQENELVRKNIEENITKTTENIINQFTSITKKVAIIDDRLEKNEDLSNLLKKSLSNPIDVGTLSEIGLKNCLEAFGFKENRDFFIQYHATYTEDETGNLEEKNYRPDALLFIGNNAIIFDSKASKFFAEISSVKSDDEEQKALSDIKKTVNQHLKSLHSKNYHEHVKKNIEKDFIGSGRSGEVENILTIMYVANDAIIQKINQADPEFISKALSYQIFLSGPSGIHTLVHMLSLKVLQDKQEKNNELIMQEVKNLIISVAKLHEFSEHLGDSIKKSIVHYNKFASSFNSNFLSKVRRINKLGLEKGSNLAKLKRYEVIATNLEGEAEELQFDNKDSQLEGYSNEIIASSESLEDSDIEDNNLSYENNYDMGKIKDNQSN